MNAPMNALDTATSSTSLPVNGKRRKALLTIAAIFAVLAVGWLLLWWLVFSRRETTDDAYVAGDQVGVSAQTAGTVIGVLADDTQRVEAGQVLVRLDRTDNEVALAHAASTLALSVRQARQLGAMAEQAQAQVAARRQELTLAQAQLARRQPLQAQQAIATEELQQASTSVDVARSTLQAAIDQERAARAVVTDAPADNPGVQEARAQFVQAWIAARRTSVRAPTGGYVARRNVQVGQRVPAGQTLMSIVALDRLWVDANFKEGQLRALRIDQPVRVETDLYGGEVTFHGRVGGMAAGTGAAFSLLPAQNATGNWIKVVQRVPVRILLDAKELRAHPLRIGLSTRVNVDTQDQRGVVLAMSPSSAPTAATDIYAQDYQAAQQAADALIRGEPVPQP